MDSQTETEMHRANEGCIAMLIEMARSDPQPPFSIVRSLAPRLLELDEAARQRAGQRPYLLVDFRLADGPWWRSYRHGKSDSPQASWTSRFPRSAAVELTRRSLILAWHATRAHLPESHLSLGVSPEVASVLCQMTLAELERLADERLDLMRPRWENRLGLWRRLLEGAQSADAQARNFLDRVALHLLVTDLMRKR